MLDRVHRSGADGVPGFIEAGAPADEELHAQLQAVIALPMEMLTRPGVRVEDMGPIYLAAPYAWPMRRASATPTSTAT